MCALRGRGGEEGVEMGDILDILKGSDIVCGKGRSEGGRSAGEARREKGGREGQADCCVRGKCSSCHA